MILSERWIFDGYRQKDQGTPRRQGAHPGRAGRPRGVIEGLYITGREGSDLSIDCDTDGYFAVSGRFCQRVFYRRTRRTDCIYKGRLLY